MDKGQELLFISQKDADINDPEKKDLFEVGTLGKVLQLLKLPDGTVKVLVEGLKRAKVEEFLNSGSFLEAKIEVISEDKDFSREDKALSRQVISRFEDFVKTNNKITSDISYPWEETENRIDSDTLKKRDKWQSLFMPSGAFVSGRIDNKHWLTFGTIDTLPLLYSNFPVLMAGSGSKAVIRVGELINDTNQDVYKTINWSDIPAGNDLNIRMSGLVWPEASARIANSAYLTQERYGKGQIILFSGEPNFRGSSLGTNRLWLNSVIYGSGLGTSSRITP